jgi:membrane associated rhomboid family serine protease
MEHYDPRTEQRPVPLLTTVVGLLVAVWGLWVVAITRGELLLAVMEHQFTVSAARVLTHPWTLWTSALSHANVIHLAANLLTLWTFGIDLERSKGSRATAQVLFAGAGLASVAHLLAGWAAGTNVPALGASGAVMALILAQARLQPDRQVIFLVLPLPIRVAAGAAVALDIVGLWHQSTSPVAHAAHLGGALAGWLWTDWWRRTHADEPASHRL